MKTCLVAVLGLLLLSGALAQEASPAAAEECDPFAAGTALVDLAEDIGTLACKVPSSLNLTAVMSQLTGLVGALSLAELKIMPAYLEIMLSVSPGTLMPFLALKPVELQTLLPLLTEVPVPTLKAVFPLIGRSGGGSIKQMVTFLQGLSPGQLQKLLPLLATITPGQINVLRQAVNLLPSGSIDTLIQIVQSLGPVTDSVVAVKGAFGLLRGAPTPAPAPAPTPRFVPPFASLFGRRRLFQEAAAAGGSGAAAACDPGMAGIEVGVSLVNDFGKIVCQFGGEELRPILKNLLVLLNKQSTTTLGNLPRLTVALSKADPKLFPVFFKIPAKTLKEVIPVLSGLEGGGLEGILKTFGTTDTNTISTLVYFLQQVPVSTIENLLPLFGSLTPSQTQSLLKLLNAMTASQITLTIHLLATFNFGVDSIAAAVPPAQDRGLVFNIGPVRITIGAPSNTGFSVNQAGVPFIHGKPGFGFFG